MEEKILDNNIIFVDSPQYEEGDGNLVEVADEKNREKFETAQFMLSMF